MSNACYPLCPGTVQTLRPYAPLFFFACFLLLFLAIVLTECEAQSLAKIRKNHARTLSLAQQLVSIVISAD